MMRITIDNFVSHLKKRKKSPFISTYFYEVRNQLYYDDLYRSWSRRRFRPTDDLDRNRIVLKAVLHNLVQTKANDDLKFLIKFFNEFFDEVELFEKILIEVYTEANSISDLREFIKQRPWLMVEAVKAAAKNDRLDLIILFLEQVDKNSVNEPSVETLLEAAFRTFSETGNLLQIERLLETHSASQLKDIFIDNVILPTAIENFQSTIVRKYADKNQIVDTQTKINESAKVSKMTFIGENKNNNNSTFLPSTSHAPRGLTP